MTLLFVVLGALFMPGPQRERRAEFATCPHCYERIEVGYEGLISSHQETLTVGIEIRCIGSGIPSRKARA